MQFKYVALEVYASGETQKVLSREMLWRKKIASAGITKTSCIEARTSQ